MTPEEYEKLLAQKDGQLKAKDEEIQTLKEGFANSTAKITTLETRVKSFEDKERASIEEAAHAIDPQKDLKGMSNEVVNAWVDGVLSERKKIQEAKTQSSAHGTGKAPPIANPDSVGAANSTNPQKDIKKGLLHNVGKGFMDKEE